LTRLESRPRAGRPWEYVFYADVDAAADVPAMVDALAELSEHATFTRLLGSYAKSERRPLASAATKTPASAQPRDG
jgi:chorismate mutase/prephenate dehydratase